MCCCPMPATCPSVYHHSFPFPFSAFCLCMPGRVCLAPCLPHSTSTPPALLPAPSAFPLYALPTRQACMPVPGNGCNTLLSVCRCVLTSCHVTGLSGLLTQLGFLPFASACVPSCLMPLILVPCPILFALTVTCCCLLSLLNFLLWKEEGGTCLV